MIKILKWIVLIILIPIGLLLFYIFLENRSYPSYKFRMPKEEKRKGLLLTWEATSSADFWQAYHQHLFPDLQQWHQRGDLLMVLPFDHPPLKHPDASGQWTHCTVLLFDAKADHQAISETLIASIKNSPLLPAFRAADLMQLQKGLDKLYPITNGYEREARLQNTVEYVFSNPEHRSTYYEEQYLWSGPAMADLHSRDKAGRFIGFEVEQRLSGTDTMPQWDLIHVFGFTRWQMVKSVPYFFPTWDRHARRAFGEGTSFKEKLKEWDKIRLNVKGRARQYMEGTLQAK
ncbi:MAG: hypothetical protein AAGG75_15105 [Bacteroidota bacterium]